MPSISSIMQDQEFWRLRNLIFHPPADVDHVYEANQSVNFSDARSDTDQEKGEWVGVTVKPLNFIIGEKSGGTTSTGNDDPQFIAVSFCPSPTITRSDEYEDLEEKDPKFFANHVFGTYGPLNQSDPVRFGVICDAFNNDSSEAWEGVAKALNMDVGTAFSIALNLVPGVNQFKTPGALTNGLSSIINDALTIDPTSIGTAVICDTVTNVKWFAKSNKQEWNAIKFVLHTIDGKPDSGWYLSQWLITLSKRVARYEIGYMPGSELYNHLSSTAFASLSSTEILAGISAMKGEDIVKIAKKMGLSPADVLSAKYALASASNEELAAMISTAIIDKLG